MQRKLKRSFILNLLAAHELLTVKTNILVRSKSLISKRTTGY